MSFENLIDSAIQEGIDKELAVKILKGAKDPVNGLKLFQAATSIRDDRVGKDLYLSAGISGIFPCLIVPRCKYCNYHITDMMDEEKLALAAKAIEDLGIRQVHLSGGTSLAGYDKEILSMVRAIQAVSDIDVEVNLGPSLSEETIRTLKSMGVSSITSSLETFNEAMFADSKPGDSLVRRRELMEICEREGMSIRSMMLIGLGETPEDRIDHLFYLKHFSKMYHLRFSRFSPTPNTPYSDRDRCTTWDYATTVAIARLILPNVQLGMAAGNSVDDIPLWYAAGGGNQLLGAHVSRGPGRSRTNEQAIKVSEDVYVVSKIPVLRKYVESMGRNLCFEVPK